MLRGWRSKQSNESTLTPKYLARKTPNRSIAAKKCGFDLWSEQHWDLLGLLNEREHNILLVHFQSSLWSNSKHFWKALEIFLWPVSSVCLFLLVLRDEELFVLLLAFPTNSQTPCLRENTKTSQPPWRSYGMAWSRCSRCFRVFFFRVLQRLGLENPEDALRCLTIYSDKYFGDSSLVQNQYPLTMGDSPPFWGFVRCCRGHARQEGFQGWRKRLNMVYITRLPGRMGILYDLATFNLCRFSMRAHVGDLRWGDWAGLQGQSLPARNVSQSWAEDPWTSNIYGKSDPCASRMKPKSNRPVMATKDFTRMPRPFAWWSSQSLRWSFCLGLNG